MSEEKLHKCPFCGGEAILAATSMCNGHIVCLKCDFRSAVFWNDLRGGTETWKEKAVKAWNSRAE